jgi:HEAT repeat protein
MNTRGALFCCILMVSALVPLAAVDNAAAKDKVRQTLLYGIDSQVVDAIQAIRSSQDTSFTPELVKVLSDQRSDAVQKAAMDLFKDQKVKDGEPRAKAILAAWEQTADAVLISAVQYLAAISSAGLAAGLQPLVDSDNNAVALAAIQAMGTTGDSAAAAFLVGRLKSRDFPDARKNECILAIGALKDPVAVDELISIAGNTDEEKVRRMYAADSLGKLHDAKALPVLKSMFAENDALIRLYAAGALSQFSLDDVFPSLLQGLRDENPRVREQSAKTLARTLSPSQAEAALPILSYKAEFDPEAIVRTASIQALGSIGGTGAMATLRKIYAGSDHALDSREAALGILVTKDLAGTMDAVRSVISTEWGSFDTRGLESTARVLAGAHGAELKDVLVRLLDSPDSVVRSYAARGIGANGFSDLKDRLKKMSEQDPSPGTRREAALALAKL